MLADTGSHVDASKAVVERCGPAVIVDYHDLCDPNRDLSASIQEAFGSHDEALGIILVRNIPEYVPKRARLLFLASKLAQLPKNVLESMEDPVSKYMFGWSHGKEVMNGKPDFAKGSFYANPVHDVPTEDPELIKEYPEYCHPNIWPADLPELRDAFRDLGGLMVQVGGWVARECDKFLKRTIEDYPDAFLYKMVTQTRSAKARLLHYFPVDEGQQRQISNDQDSWCGWHLDHSCITGLTSAMYLDENQPDVELETVGDAKSGLYIKNRGGNMVKVDIPRDCLAFQTGEALEISSRKHLRATPHCVKSAMTMGSSGQKIARNTIALFIQPDWTQDLLPGYPFTQFTKETLAKHYGS